MAKQYWVGEFYVDLSRNQISQLGQSQTLPPKALQVLTQLAENRGKVVSYDVLLENVWPNTVVTPNTLQRCVAQLRKALKEDSKAQGIIKTHAKQGYSLECDVSWSEDTQPMAAASSNDQAKQPANEQVTVIKDAPAPDGAKHAFVESPKTSHKETNSKKFNGFLAMAAALALVAFFLPFSNKSKPELQFSDLRYLTATDDKEFGGSYSPDGQYILFRRYFDQVCVNNLWAKHADTLEEVQLTSERGTYGNHSLSADGKTLVFIREDDCSKPITQNRCYTLMSINFEDALITPQQPKALLDCQHSVITTPVWIDSQHIVMRQKEEQQWRLIRYSVVDNSTTTLYQIEDGNILYFAYSAERDLIAVTSIKSDNKQYVELISPQGDLISSHTIQLPADAPRHTLVMATFGPNSQDLYFGYGGQLYRMSEQGHVAQVEFPFAYNVGAPNFHPDGSRMLLIKGQYDGDIARLPIPDLSNEYDEQAQSQADTAVFERSIESEDYAVYQPGGDSIAFASGRTGRDQIWLHDDNGTRVISNLAKGKFIGDLRWDLSGNSLLVMSGNELHKISLSGATSTVNFPYPVMNLFHWDSDNQQVIANILVNGSFKFVELDLNTLEYQPINHKRVSWAAKKPGGPLIFIDHMDRIWQQNAIEDKLIEPLSDQGSSKRFLVKNELVYGINEEDQLWAYSLESGDFKLLAEVTSSIDYLTDVNDEAFLVTVLVAEKKEVIELSVNY